MTRSGKSIQDNRVSTAGSLSELIDLEADWKQLSDSAPDTHLAALFPVVFANARWQRQDEPWRCYTLRARDGYLRLGLFGRRARSAIKHVAVAAFVVGTEYMSSFAMAPETDAGEVRKLMDAIAGDNRDCTVIEFSKTSADELKLLRAAASETGAMHTHVTDITGYFFDTRTSIDEHFEKLGPRHRRNLRRERKRLDEGFLIEFDTIQSTSVTQNLECLSQYVDLEASGWKGRNGTDIRSTELDYYRCLVESSTKEGLIRWYRLQANGKPIAMYLCFQHLTTLWASKTTFDERFAQYSPGNQLLLRLLEHACKDHGIKRLHMITKQPWVTSWRPLEEQYYRFRIYQPTVPGRLLYLAERARERLWRGTP